MMRKGLLTIAIMVCTCLEPSSFEAKRSHGLDITAYNGQYHDIIITPIEGSLSDPIGMPFDLTGEDVAYVAGNSTTAGREIANWSIHSNYTPLRIQIDAEPLKPESVNESTATVGYYLYWPYIYETAAGEDIQGYMKVHSGDSYDSWSDKVLNNSSAGYESLDLQDEYNPISVSLPDSGLDTAIFPIRFMLDETTSSNINDRTAYPAGPYAGNVTVTVEGS